MRTIIAGSRHFTNVRVFTLAMREIVMYKCLRITEVVSGTAKGADELGERWAIWTGVPCRRFRPQGKLYGKAAPFLRNEAMANNADALIAFWDGQSRGTKHMISVARKLNLNVTVYNFITGELT